MPRQTMDRIAGRCVLSRAFAICFAALFAVGASTGTLLAGGDTTPGPQEAELASMVHSEGEQGHAPNVAATEMDPRPDAAAPPNNAVSKAALINLSHVESIRVRVSGYNELSGDYNLDPRAALSFPRIGRIETAALTTAELERILAEKLSALTRADVSIAVDVTRYRPYFIMGQVAQPGAIEWRPGLKVIQAISLAQGAIRPAADNSIGLPPGMSPRQSDFQRVFALAQLARLKAERDGKSTVELDSQVYDLVSRAPEESRATLIALISRQNPMLQEQRAFVQAQIEGLQRDRKSAEREIEATLTQEKAVQEQLEITRAQMADIESLMRRQLVTRHRYLEQKSDLVAVEVQYAEAQSVLERARTRLSSIDQQLVAIPQQRRAALNQQIDALESEVSPHSHSISAGGLGTPRLNYFIAREGSTGLETIAANGFTEVLPGDVLIVSNGSGPESGIATAEGAAANDNGIADAAQRMIEAGAVEAQSSGSRAATAATASRSPYDQRPGW